MSKPLQWVAGIGMVLVVVALVFSSIAPFLLPRLGLAAAPQMIGPLHMFGPNMPFMRSMPFGISRMGMHMPFMGIVGLAACLWPLLLVGLVVWGISLLTRRPGPYMAPAIPAAPATIAQAAAGQAACSNCGQPLQPGWRHCPNCGTPVAQ
jgi:hypothetical protein